jgi:hypothetical protein
MRAASVYLSAILPEFRPIEPSYSKTNMMDFRGMDISSWSASIDAVLEWSISRREREGPTPEPANLFPGQHH